MKIKYTLEYPMNCSPVLLYPRISSPGGLSEWFADNVNIEGRFYNFFWDNTSQKAEVLNKRENHFIRLKWVDDDQENSFFEFRIMGDELTGDISLVITDFVEPDEKEDAVDLWNSQVAGLKHCVGV